MQKTGRYGRHASPGQIPLAGKGLAVIFALCLAVRLLSALGADTSAKNTMSGLFSNDSVANAILRFELGSTGDMEKSVSVASIVLDPSLIYRDSPEAEAEIEPSPGHPPGSAATGGGIAPGSSAVPSSSPTTGSSAASGSAEPTANGGSSLNADDAWLYYHEWNAPAPSATPNVITKPAQATSAEAISVYNKTSYSVNTAALLKEPLKITLAPKKPAVLIVHTHGSEAYMPSGKDQYTPSDPYRTQNQAQSVTRVGDELAAAFEQKGISVIHDTGVYDYPSYTQSYTNSGAAIQGYLKKYPSIKIVIDLHRDALEDDDGNVYRTVAQVGSAACSQVMLFIGTDNSGLKHPNWKENLKLALHMQQEMNRLYPSLARPIELSTLRYNQQLTLGSMIVEVGCTGNTLQESLTAARYFADAASKVLLGLYK